MFTIKTPVKGYTGFGYGLHFTNGEAHTENIYIAKTLSGLGYEVIDSAVNNDQEQTAELEEEQTAEPDEDDTQGSEELSLREQAELLGLKPHWNASDDTIAKMIAEHQEG